MTIKEFIDTIKPGETFSLEKFIESTADENIQQAAVNAQDLLANKAELGIERVNREIYVRQYSGKEDFIVKAANEATSATNCKDWVDCWIKHIPEGRLFTAGTLVFHNPNKYVVLAVSTYKKYLDKYVANEQLSKLRTDYLGIVYVKLPKSDKKVEEKPEPVYNELQQLFIDFLKNEGVYEKFVAKQPKSLEFLLTKGYSGLNTWSLYNDPISWMSQGFSWVSSAEGFDFWRDIETKWLTRLCEFFIPEYVGILEKIINVVETYDSGEGNNFLRTLARALLDRSEWKTKWNILVN